MERQHSGRPYQSPHAQVELPSVDEKRPLNILLHCGLRVHRTGEEVLLQFTQRRKHLYRNDAESDAVHEGHMRTTVTDPDVRLRSVVTLDDPSVEEALRGSTSNARRIRKRKDGAHTCLKGIGSTTNRLS